MEGKGGAAKRDRGKERERHRDRKEEKRKKEGGERICTHKHV